MAGSTHAGDRMPLVDLDDPEELRACVNAPALLEVTPAEERGEQEPFAAAEVGVVDIAMHAAVREFALDGPNRLDHHRLRRREEAKRRRACGQARVEPVSAEPLAEVAVVHAFVEHTSPDLRGRSCRGRLQLRRHEGPTRGGVEACMERGECRCVPVLGVLLPPVVAGLVPECDEVADGELDGMRVLLGRGSAANGVLVE